MRRLIERNGRERGAVAVIVAISMVVLMGFAALAIDMGSAYSDRQQLQNGADAGALAIAQSCQNGGCSTTFDKTETLKKADKYVKANKLDGQATGTVVNWAAGTVTVEGSSTHTNWFTGFMGLPTTPVSATASATWGYPSGGVVLPLTFSWCEFQAATGGWDDQGTPLHPNVVTIAPLKEQTCTPPAHNAVPGGFGWLSGANSTCLSTVKAGNWVLTDPGADLPSNCKSIDWNGLHNATVFVPIFEDHRGNGNNGEYLVKGLAAFTITGYCFSQDVQWQMTDCPNKKAVKGTFTSYSKISGDYTIDPTAAHFGGGTVGLSA